MTLHHGCSLICSSCTWSFEVSSGLCCCPLRLVWTVMDEHRSDQGVSWLPVSDSSVRFNTSIFGSFWRFTLLKSPAGLESSWQTIMYFQPLMNILWIQSFTTVMRQTCHSLTWRPAWHTPTTVASWSLHNSLHRSSCLQITEGLTESSTDVDSI